jgi:hypothetical protein
MNNKLEDFKELVIGFLAIFGGTVMIMYILEKALTLLFGEL